MATPRNARDDRPRQDRKAAPGTAPAGQEVISPLITARISIRTLTAMLGAIVAGRLDPADTSTALRFLLDGTEGRIGGERPRDQIERVGTIMRESGLLGEPGEPPTARAAGGTREKPTRRRNGRSKRAAQKRATRSRGGGSADTRGVRAKSSPASKRQGRESLAATLEEARLI